MEPVDDLAVLDPNVVVDQLAVTHNTDIGDLHRKGCAGVYVQSGGAFLCVTRDKNSTPATHCMHSLLSFYNFPATVMFRMHACSG